ncbi:hypothetical protein CesoFtcFv8_016974 [Champsocephalus esox]|uniref:Uncharacterized protein n=1 Tax=Champsocephalus esox TaxID=159716 RepID=A0AAN8BIY5_9TELE|nr:hypothetical protein CesoFtcFv8_016974 [Champsocephalus esox]
MVGGGQCQPIPEKHWFQNVSEQHCHGDVILKRCASLHWTKRTDYWKRGTRRKTPPGDQTASLGKLIPDPPSDQPPCAHGRTVSHGDQLQYAR